MVQITSMMFALCVLAVTNALLIIGPLAVWPSAITGNTQIAQRHEPLDLKPEPVHARGGFLIDEKEPSNDRRATSLADGEEPINERRGFLLDEPEPVHARGGFLIDEKEPSNDRRGFLLDEPEPGRDRRDFLFNEKEPSNESRDFLLNDPEPGRDRAISCLGRRSHCISWGEPSVVNLSQISTLNTPSDVEPLGAIKASVMWIPIRPPDPEPIQRLINYSHKQTMFQPNLRSLFSRVLDLVPQTGRFSESFSWCLRSPASSLGMREDAMGEPTVESIQEWCRERKKRRTPTLPCVFRLPGRRRGELGLDVAGCVTHARCPLAAPVALSAVATVEGGTRRCGRRGGDEGGESDCKWLLQVGGKLEVVGPDSGCGQDDGGVCDGERSSARLGTPMVVYGMLGMGRGAWQAEASSGGGIVRKLLVAGEKLKTGSCGMGTTRAGGTASGAGEGRDSCAAGREQRGDDMQASLAQRRMLVVARDVVGEVGGRRGRGGWWSKREAARGSCTGGGDPDHCRGRRTTFAGDRGHGLGSLEAE
ncbi:hypothetical protein B0H13DRAFT_2277957 [Mycena leptocephala]|nr:hypothetical protein B0H13DRAFT_2277957 [Mycena leptocephala]